MTASPGPGPGTPDLLATIVAATRRTVDARAAACPAANLQPDVTGADPRGGRFHAALTAQGGLNVIAECKRRSPSRGILRMDYDPAAIARGYAAAGAAAISVLTEPTFFDGSLDDLRLVRAAVDVPVLRKDFIVNEYQLLEACTAGADAVLLIVAVLKDRPLRQLMSAADRLGLATLVEVHDGVELERALEAGAEIIGVNSRNLKTLAVNTNVLTHLARRMPSDVVAVAESGLRTRADLARVCDAGYRACLIGESLMTAPDPGAALAALRRPADASTGRS